MQNRKDTLVYTEGTKAPWYTGWNISDERREEYRKCSINSKKRKDEAIKNNKPYHEIYYPRLKANDLMPTISSCGLKSLSLFSGGGGLDIGFEKAGFIHIASYEILENVCSIVQKNRPNWKIFSGKEGDVRFVDWTQYKGIDVIHGGPPCQPFSIAGRQKGEDDVRNMVPEFIRCIKECCPKAFVMENVSALASNKFESYLFNEVFYKLKKLNYYFTSFILNAENFGVPQTRKRFFIVGFSEKKYFEKYKRPIATFHPCDKQLNNLLIDIPITMGVREALGLPDIGFDSSAPTIRSGFTGPRQTTSIVNSVAASKKWEELGIWPNGVSITREIARCFKPKNNTFRLSIADVALIQGFPEDWKFGDTVYLALGQIGNSVVPPVAYHIAKSIRYALS